MLGWRIPKITDVFKSQLSEEDREQARESAREEERRRFMEAAAGVIPDETIERIKERMEQSRRQ